MPTVNSIDEIKQRVDPLQVYGEYLRLTSKGKKAKGLCPFHKEKTPSFSADADSGLFYCFGCHKGGDVLQFIQEMEGCTFREAVEVLARKAGVTYTWKGKSQQAELPDRKDRIRKLTAAAQSYYRECLQRAPPRSPVAEYVSRRGILPATAEAMGLGYAPPGGGLAPHLSRLGFGTEEMVEAGLMLERAGGEISERFKCRLIFPIFDTMGRAVGFGGRSMDGEEPKYLNSPESPVFQKREILYGLSWTKGAIRDKGSAILVEGYMDFLSLFQAGITNAVASLGTALAEGQMRLLKRYASEVVLNFDRDPAGLAAAKRAIEGLLGQEVKIRIAVIPQGKDPDEFIKAKGGEAYAAVIEEAAPFFSYLAELSQADAVLHTVEGDLKVLDELAEYLKAVPDPLERECYARDLAGRLRMDPIKILRKIDHPDRRISKQGADQIGKVPDVPSKQQILVAGLLAFPAVRADVAGLLPEEFIGGLAAGPLIANLLGGRPPEGPEQTVLLAYIKHNCHEAPTVQDTVAAAASILLENLMEKERKVQQQIRDASSRNDLGLVQILNREKIALVKRRLQIAQA